MSQAWDNKYGRVRLTAEMATELLSAVDNEIDDLWEQRDELPNPSDESLDVLRRIRLLEHTRRNIIGTAQEKGWPLE